MLYIVLRSINLFVTYGNVMIYNHRLEISRYRKIPKTSCNSFSSYSETPSQSGSNPVSLQRTHSKAFRYYFKAPCMLNYLCPQTFVSLSIYFITIYNIECIVATTKSVTVCFHGQLFMIDIKFLQLIVFVVQNTYYDSFFLWFL